MTEASSPGTDGAADEKSGEHDGGERGHAAPLQQARALGVGEEGAFRRCLRIPRLDKVFSDLLLRGALPEALAEIRVKLPHGRPERNVLY